MVQAAILDASPPYDEQARQTRAHLQLARTYREAGRFDDAIVEFSAAPMPCFYSSVEARSGLGSTWSLCSRASMSVSANCCRRRAPRAGVELLRRQLLSEQASGPGTGSLRSRRCSWASRWARDDDACRNEGMICNFIGMTLQALGATECSSWTSASPKPQLAVERIPDYYQPHENLADTYVFKAKKLAAEGVPADNLEVVRNLRWGIEHYGRALEVLKGSPLHGKPEGDAVRRLRPSTRLSP